MSKIVPIDYDDNDDGDVVRKKISTLKLTPTDDDNDEDENTKSNAITIVSPSSSSSSTTTTLPFPKIGVHLKFLDEFVDIYCGGNTSIEGFTTTDICEKIVKPITASGIVIIIYIVTTNITSF